MTKLHPDEIKARQYGWDYECGYSQGQQDGGFYGSGLYKDRFPKRSEAMKGYRDGYDDAKRARK